MDKGVSRRMFLELASTGAAAAGVMPALAQAKPTGAVPAWAQPKTKVRVAKVYLGSAHCGWPTPLIDLPLEVKRFESELGKLNAELADIEFVECGVINTAEQAAAIGTRLKGVDGILAIHLTLGTGTALAKLLEFEIPLMFFTMPYSGHEWHTVAGLQREGRPIECLPSSNYADLATAVRPFRAMRRLKEAKVLHIGRTADPKYVAAIRESFGTEIKTLEPEALFQAYEAVDLAAAEADAKQWMAGAEKIVEPTRDDIVKGARMSLALMRLVEAERAAAITINCLGMGLIERGMGYPCLGFCHLNNIGLGGVCEADLKSTMTHLVFLNLVGKPGFVSDPCFDMATSTIIHAHCVAATRMDGPQGEVAPYAIRSHLEDNKGAVLQVKMRVGEKVSMARLIDNKVMLFSTGKIVGVPDVDRGCRTKIATQVEHPERFLENWSSGLHRVVFYGDHTMDVRRFCRFKGLQLVREGVDDLPEMPELEFIPRVHA